MDEFSDVVKPFLQSRKEEKEEEKEMIISFYHFSINSSQIVYNIVSGLWMTDITALIRNSMFPTARPQLEIVARAA